MDEGMQEKRPAYLGVLHEIHKLVSPRNYLEIGCRFGDSLFLSKCPTIAIDPANRLKSQLRTCDQYFQMTSDDFFAQYSIADFAEGPIDLAFIDGMHLAEFALRDFINAEANMPASGVIVMDDVLPATIDFATRQQRPGAWTGDVYKVVRILKEYRPDLEVDVFSVPVKGLAVVRNLDPSSTVLRSRYATIEDDILGGRWSVRDVETLRREFVPRPISDIVVALAQTSR